MKQALRDVEIAKDNKAEVLGRIAGRKAGPFGIIVTVFGDQVPAARL